MTAEFWGGIAGVVVVNAGLVIFLSGRIVERIDGLRALVEEKHYDHEKRITRVENFIDNRRAVPARGGA